MLPSWRTRPCSLESQLEFALVSSLLSSKQATSLEQLELAPALGLKATLELLARPKAALILWLEEIRAWALAGQVLGGLQELELHPAGRSVAP